MLLCFRKQHVLPRLFIRNLCRDEMNYFDTRDWFFFSDRKSEAMKLVKIVHSPQVNSLTHGRCITSLTNKQSILICRGGQQILNVTLL